MGSGLNPILSPALPAQSSSAPAANLSPGNPRPGCGREVWVERQRDCYDLHFFWQILNKHLGKALNSSWKIPAASRRGAARSCRSRATCPQQPPRLPPGIVLPSVSRLSEAQIVQEQLKSRWEPARGLGPPLPQLLPPFKSQMRLWWPGGDVAAAGGEQQSPALLLLPETSRFLPKSSLS